jgi:hypothetical protein
MKFASFFILLIFTSAIAVGCTTGNMMTLPSPTNHPQPTKTQEATQTPSPSLTPTPTPLPSSAFSVQIIGYDVHGAMIELIYNGSEHDLRDITPRMKASQNGKSIETQEFEIIDNRYLAEITDAKYTIGEITIEILLARETGVPQVVSTSANYEHIYPFIAPIFFQSEVQKYSLTDRNHTQDGFYGHDLWFGSGISGIPVHIPFSLQIIRIRSKATTNDPSYPKNYNIWFYSPATGYSFVLCHQQLGESILELIDGETIEDFGWGYPLQTAPIIPYNPDTIISIIGPKDTDSGLAHVHIGGQIPDVNLAGWEPFFGYNHKHGLCEGTPPCSQIPDIELKDFLLNGWVDKTK